MERRIDRHSTEDFQGIEHTLYDTIMQITCYYTFVQTHRMYSTKHEPSWALGDYAVSCTILLNDVDNGEVTHA